MVHPPVAKPVTPLWDSLAAVRFFLALVIVANHVRLLAPMNAAVAALSECSGYAAILSFLIISGFSIAHSIGRGPQGFYRRRFARIYPLYFLAIALPLLLNISDARFNRHDVTTAIGNLFFLQSFTILQTRFNPVLWTLAVEAACYAMAPWFALRRTWLLLLLAAVSAAAFIFAAFVEWPYPSYMSYGEPLLITAWAWIGGFILYRFHRNLWAAWLLGGSAIAVMLLAGSSFGRFYVVPFAVVTAAFAFGKWVKLPKVMRLVMSLAGDVSYPLYLFHLPTLDFLVHRIGVRSNFVLFASSIAVAIAFTFVDFGFKRLRRAVIDVSPGVGNGAVEPSHTTGSGSPMRY